MGLDVYLYKYGKSPLKQKVELPSSKYPDHCFKIGYFRSSYNEGGVDHILRDRTGHELATIFDVNGNYRVKPNWETARKKAVSVLDSLKKYLDTNGSYHVMTVENNPFRQSIDIKSQKDALEAFNEERQRYGRGGSDFNWYSNHKGEFFLGKPPALVAAINGISGTFKQPCAYLIYKSDDEEGEGLDWYIHALEIVIETIDYVLAQPDPDKYYLHWSR